MQKCAGHGQGEPHQGALLHCITVRCQGFYDYTNRHMHIPHGHSLVCERGRGCCALGAACMLDSHVFLMANYTHKHRHCRSAADPSDFAYLLQRFATSGMHGPTLCLSDVTFTGYHLIFSFYFASSGLSLHASLCHTTIQLCQQSSACGRSFTEHMAPTNTNQVVSWLGGISGLLSNSKDVQGRNVLKC